MSETVIVKLFSVFRVLLLGGILLVLPLIGRKGLLFGVYVGEERADANESRLLRRRWLHGCLLLAAVALGVALAPVSPIASDLAATAILIVGASALYLQLHYSARTLAPASAARQATQAVAALDEGEPRGSTLARATLAICILAGLATAYYTTVRYGDLPDRIPTHFGISGQADAWSDRSVVSAMLLPSLTLVLCPFVALFALLTARAKRSIRAGTGGRSVEAQDAYRAATANLLSGTALFTCALMSFLSVQSIRVALSEADSLGSAMWWILGAMMLFLFGGLLRILIKYGQGGSRIEQASSDAPLTNGLADDSHWVWGVLYINRDDPSILVEKRFGLGYTINLGNRQAVAIMVTFLVLTLGLTAVALIATT